MSMSRHDEHVGGVRISGVCLAGCSLRSAPVTWESRIDCPPPLPPSHTTYLHTQAQPLLLVLALAQEPPQGPPLLPLLLLPLLRLHNMQSPGERKGGERVNASK